MLSQHIVERCVHEVCTLRRMPSERPIDIALRLAKARGWNQTEFAAALGVTSAVISNWKSRGMPADQHMAVAAVFGVSVDQLVGLVAVPEDFDDIQPIDLDAHPGLVRIRRVQLRLQAGVHGYSIDADESDGSPLFFRADWLKLRGYKPDHLVAIKVMGQSMEPTLYPDDMVVVNTTDTEPKDGKVFAINYEGEAVIKRMVRDAGSWWLASDNPDQRRFPRKECADGACIIVGQVIHRQSEQI